MLASKEVCVRYARCWHDPSSLYDHRRVAFHPWQDESVFFYFFLLFTYRKVWPFYFLTLAMWDFRTLYFMLNHFYSTWTLFKFILKVAHTVRYKLYLMTFLYEYIVGFVVLISSLFRSFVKANFGNIQNISYQPRTSCQWDWVIRKHKGWVFIFFTS